MKYPNFKDKYLHEALFHPEDFIKYRKWHNLKLPSKIILTYQRNTKNYFVRKYKPKRLKLYSLVDMHLYKDIGFVRMAGIGAPHAVAVFEELIALGGKTFINIGTAGGLHREGIFVCTKALRDEGTSYHYLKSGDFSYPNEKLTKKFEQTLRKKGVPFLTGPTWTIDAPYRETKAEVEHYSKKGIATVEMETSALFAVAAYRKVKIAASFVVSDLLGKKWLPKFHRFDTKQAQRRLIDAAVECLSNKKVL